MEALRAYLEREGHEVFVFAPRFPGYRDEGDFVRRFPSITPPAKVRFPLALPVAPGLFREVRRLNIDLFHTHHPFGMGAIASRFARRLQRPIVTTIHTQYEHYLHYIPVPTPVLRPVVRRIVAGYCNACHGVTTPAAGMAAVIRDYGVSNPVAVVPNGVNLQRYRDADGAAARRRLGLSSDMVVGLFTGRIAPEKNLPALLEMTRQVTQQHPEFRLVVLGDGPDLPALRRQAAEMGIAAHVLFPGAVTHEEVAPFCAMADLFLTASVTEVNPTSVIEAMAAGTPTVAYDTFGAREIVRVGEDGLLTEHTPQALAAALSGLLTNREALARMAAQAIRNADRFSLEATGRQMMDVYARARERLAR